MTRKASARQRSIDEGRKNVPEDPILAQAKQLARVRSCIADVLTRHVDILLHLYPQHARVIFEVLEGQRERVYDIHRRGL